MRSKGPVNKTLAAPGSCDPTVVQMTRQAQLADNSMYTMTHIFELQKQTFPVRDSESVFLKCTGLLQLLD